MGKQLIGRDNVEQFICHDERKLYVNKTMILSPGGKDYLHEQGVTIVYGERPMTGSKPAQKTGSAGAPDLNLTVQEILKRDYAITDILQVSAITKKVLAKLDNDQ